MAYLHTEDGIVQTQDDGRFLSWRGGIRNPKAARPVIQADWDAALFNAQNYPPLAAWRLRGWLEEWSEAEGGVG